MGAGRIRFDSKTAGNERPARGSFELRSSCLTNTSFYALAASRVKAARPDRGCNSAGRVLASQARCRGFESHHPLLRPVCKAGRLLVTARALPNRLSAPPLGFPKPSERRLAFGGSPGLRLRRRRRTTLGRVHAIGHELPANGEVQTGCPRCLTALGCGDGTVKVGKLGFGEPDGKRPAQRAEESAPLPLPHAAVLPTPRLGSRPRDAVLKELAPAVPTINDTWLGQRENDLGANDLGQRMSSLATAGRRGSVPTPPRVALHRGHERRVTASWSRGFDRRYRAVHGATASVPWQERPVRPALS
jgi:hypothetical protein